MVPSHHAGRIFSLLSPLSFLTPTSCRAQKNKSNNFFCRIKTSHCDSDDIKLSQERILSVCLLCWLLYWTVYHQYIHYSNYIDDIYIYENSVKLDLASVQRRGTLSSQSSVSTSSPEVPIMSTMLEKVTEPRPIMTLSCEVGWRKKKKKWNIFWYLKRPVSSPVRLRGASSQLWTGKHLQLSVL